jgi:protein-tyrosine phosphatase
MLDKMLVVCVGNICRSPLGERLLRKYLPNKDIHSAGIKALVGNTADDKVIEVACEHHLAINDHCARQLTSQLCREYDLILVMEKIHINIICELVPEVRGKVMLFGHWTSQEIADPYKKGIESFRTTYFLLDDAAKKWASKLS